MFRRRLAGALVVLALSGCGHHLDRAEIAAASDGGVVTDGDAYEVSGGAQQTVPGTDETATGGTVPTGVPTVDPSTGETIVPGSAAPGPPIVVGFIGTLTGLAAISGSADSQPGIEAWAADVNGRGGINGHPVDLRVRDDGGDAVRGLRMARELVEQEHVVAMVGNFQVSSMAAVEPYLRELGIPVVGGDEASSTWFSSPVLFPQGSSTYAATYSMAAVAVSRGRHNLALFYCAESEACTSSAAAARSDGSIRAAGADLVYEAQVSIAQPDFTAECLGARGEGVDTIIAFTDQVGIGRIAGSCARQGYRPTFISSAVDDRVLDDPNLEGFIQSVDSFPWAGLSTPAIEAFKTALATYAPGTEPNYFTASAWSAGKLFERALRDVTGEVTTQTVLDALHALSGDDLGLLPSAPDYEPGVAHPGSRCGFAIVATQGEWVVHDGGRPICAP